MTEPTDYVALQKEMSERTGQRRCDECVEVDYVNWAECIQRDVFRVGFELIGWVRSPSRASLIHHCKDCRAHNEGQPFGWIADIPHERFVQWMESHPEAFTLDSMRVLLPDGHPFLPERDMRHTQPYNFPIMLNLEDGKPPKLPTDHAWALRVGSREINLRNPGEPLEPLDMSGWTEPQPMKVGGPLTREKILGHFDAEVIFDKPYRQTIITGIGVDARCGKCEKPEADCMCGGFKLL